MSHILSCNRSFYNPISDYTGISGHSLVHDRVRKHYLAPDGDRKIGMFFSMILFFDPRESIPAEQIEKIQRYNPILMEFLRKYRPSLYKGKYYL